MEQINKKVEGFLELSREFTVSSNEVYDGFQETYYNLKINGSLGYAVDYDSRQPEEKALTKLEQFEIAQKEKIEKAKRFEEYLQLQKELGDYFTSLNKLTQ